MTENFINKLNEIDEQWQEKLTTYKEQYAVEIDELESTVISNTNSKPELGTGIIDILQQVVDSWQDTQHMILQLLHGTEKTQEQLRHLEIKVRSTDALVNLMA